VLVLAGPPHTRGALHLPVALRRAAASLTCTTPPAIHCVVTTRLLHKPAFVHRIACVVSPGALLTRCHAAMLGLQILLCPECADTPPPPYKLPPPPDAELLAYKVGPLQPVPVDRRRHTAGRCCNSQTRIIALEGCCGPAACTSAGMPPAQS
jgi:hypothetical protein